MFAPNLRLLSPVGRDAASSGVSESSAAVIYSAAGAGVLVVIVVLIGVCARKAQIRLRRYAAPMTFALQLCADSHLVGLVHLLIQDKRLLKSSSR